LNPFTIATYNVNSIRSRLHILLPWLETHRPDVFCMQETKVDDGRFPADAFTNLGYHCIFRGAKQYNGVAIASLAEPEAVRYGFPDGGASDDDRLLCGVFDGVAVVNAYVPQGRDRESEHFAYKLAWFQRLKTFLAAHYSPARPLACCGDLNCAREAIDVHDPKRLRGHVCFTPEVWDAFDALTAWGLEDLLRRHHPGEANLYTFFDYRVPRSLERDLGWRIDHLLVTAPLAERSLGCRIDLEPRRAEKPSDHTILIGEFRR